MYIFVDGFELWLNLSSHVCVCVCVCTTDLCGRGRRACERGWCSWNHGQSFCVQVRAEIKLPLLYLVDSIMKNLGGEFLQLFSKNIVRVFCHAFESLVCMECVA